MCVQKQHSHYFKLQRYRMQDNIEKCNRHHTYIYNRFSLHRLNLLLKAGYTFFLLVRQHNATVRTTVGWFFGSDVSFHLNTDFSLVPHFSPTKGQFQEAEHRTLEGEIVFPWKKIISTSD